MPAMRRPTPDSVSLAYWRHATGQPVTDAEALAHLAQRHDEDPEAGFYRTRLRVGAPWVPARIWRTAETDEAGDLTEPETLHLEIEGSPIMAIDRWWLRLQAITEAQWIELAAERARLDAVGDAYRASLAPVDLTRTWITP